MVIVGDLVDDMIYLWFLIFSLGYLIRIVLSFKKEKKNTKM